MATFKATIVKASGPNFTVRIDEGRVTSARLATRLARTTRGSATEGRRVLVSGDEDGAVLIIELLGAVPELPVESATSRRNRRRALKASG